MSKQVKLFLGLIALLVIVIAGVVVYSIEPTNEEYEAFVDRQLEAAENSGQDVDLDALETQYDTLYDASVEPDAQVEVAQEDYPIATIEIENIGTMKFELDPMSAPQSTYNFISLANSGFYDGLTMHRIIEDFVAQGGDPAGDGTGGPGYSIEGEFLSNGIRNFTSQDIGGLAFARGQDNDSAGSQFYITIGDATFLDQDYAGFGRIIEGEDLLTKFADYSTEEEGNDILTITSVSVDTKGVEYPEPEKLNETE